MQLWGRRCQPWHLEWIFPLVLKSTYEGAIGLASCSNSNPYDLILVYRFLSKDLWIFSGWCGGYPTWDSSMVSWRVSYLFGSAICWIFEKIWTILVVPVHHRCTPVIGYFSKSRLIAIIGLPWPKTLAPTNEAIRHETSGKKPLSVKVKNWSTCWAVT
jgi:hypothetical protein